RATPYESGVGEGGGPPSRVGNPPPYRPAPRRNRSPTVTSRSREDTPPSKRASRLMAHTCHGRVLPTLGLPKPFVTPRPLADNRWSHLTVKPRQRASKGIPS